MLTDSPDGFDEPFINAHKIDRRKLAIFPYNFSVILNAVDSVVYFDGLFYFRY